jgi:hypothetical protein
LPNLSGIDRADGTPKLLSPGVKEDKSGGVSKIKDPSQFSPCCVKDIDMDDGEFPFKFTFDPIHDGFCRETSNSILTLKLKKYRLTGTDFCNDLFNILSGCRFRAEKKKGKHKTQDKGTHGNEAATLNSFTEEEETENKDSY